jgi:hypothetical protein
VIRGNTFAQRELLRAMKKRLEADGVSFEKAKAPRFSTATSESRTRRRRRRRRESRFK